MNPLDVFFLGTRGTISTDDPDFSRYGGATSCILAHFGNDYILLDGGTGLISLPKYLPMEHKTVHLLLSHPHVDHMMGLPSCAAFLDGKTSLHLYAVPRGGLGAEAQLRHLMSPPLWPVGPEIFTPPPRFTDISDDFSIGSVQVRVFEAPHPGGSSLFRLDAGDKSLVYATDLELSKQNATLAAFAQGCSLLLCDGQYSEEELPTKKGFGHSSWIQAVHLAQQCGATRLGIIHHAPERCDQALQEAEAQVKAQFPNSFFARKGACVSL